MKPEAQRIAIAEEFGYERGTLQPEFAIMPDYLNDLNEMQFACKRLASVGWRCVANMGSDGTWECFFTKRHAADCYSSIPQEGDHYGAGDTLALAIAEAFLRASGRWQFEIV